MTDEQDTPASTTSEGGQVQPSPPGGDTRTEPAKKIAETDTLPGDIAKRVRQTIEDAHDLLAFAIADGLPISNTIVKEIQKALCFLDAARPLTWQDCAVFEKAYRELAHTLSPLTTEEVRREAHPWGRETAPESL